MTIDEIGKIYEIPPLTFVELSEQGPGRLHDE